MLANYIKTLASSENPIPVIGPAFAEAAKHYHIGQLKSIFFVAPSFSTRKGEDREDILFSSGEPIEQTPAYSETYHTGEKGVATFQVYRWLGEPEFTEQEKSELKAYFDALLLSLGRFRMISAIQRIGHTDQLTGLPNTGGFLTYIDEVIAKGELTKYNAFYFNLARFSLVNKRFGTKETDTIIYRYANEVAGFLQEGECVGRLGGDNFVAIIKKERTQEFLNYISGVKTYGMLNSQAVPVTIGAVAGITEITGEIPHCGTLIEECGMALSIAKNVTKQPYAFSSADMKQRFYEERQYVAHFSEAVRNKEFKAYYQPKVQVDDYAIVGAEALVRWERDGMLVPPGEFISVFERNGMICELDFIVLEQVCSDIRRWLDMGIIPGRISVNLSRKHLSNPNLAEDIMRILGKYEMESKYLEIELTETVNAEETEQLVSFMNKMKENHIFMSIDDFGTGYSSLNLLRSFPVDVLKIDKSFMDVLDKNNRIILSNIIRMAEELGMGVVAEGVEQMHQLECLKEMKFKIVQGSLFDGPMPREAFEEKIRKGKYCLN